jgi:hypothetical protein
MPAKGAKKGLDAGSASKETTNKALGAAKEHNIRKDFAAQNPGSCLEAALGL